MKNLLIVESPAKAKTIEKLLGKDFTVRSSFGHIRDLSKGKDSVDIANGFEPTYIVSPEKTKVVKELRDAVKLAEEVWLATDEDREGEAISWHLCKVLGLNEHTTKRIVFHEITKPALQKAVASPRTVNLDLVNAQQARRVLDRLVGFELSELLWRKVRGGLSAGRVQSVAVRLIVDREREITNHESKPYFRSVAVLSALNEQGKAQNFKAELPTRYEQEGDAEAFLKKCINAVFTVANIQVKPAKRTPAAPFTTSTLQQEASRKLGFSVSRTMSVAQRLYEEGHITYMRTDSVNMSETALQEIAGKIVTEFGEKYLQTRRYKTKNANAQEAHEAIRPTYVDNVAVSQDRDQQRLYELIWKRAVASQMADAQLEKTLVDIAISTINEQQLRAEGEVIKFDGFLKLYLESNDEDDAESEGMLPPLRVNQIVDLMQLTAREQFTKAAARYSEASLVKKMEELGIGRPSTYAPTISRIMEETRGYVVRESRDGVERAYRVLVLSNNIITKKTEKEITGTEKNKLFPSDIGTIVTDFLAQHFDDVMDYSFTANIENEFDIVANGKADWRKMLGNFYHPFHEHLLKIRDEADRASGERILGKDPVTGLSILTRMGRYGALVQLGTTEELGDAKPKYGNLKKGQNLESITFEEALDLFQLPKDLGEYKGEALSIGIGRLGPYVKLGDKFTSIPKGEEALSVTYDRAVELVEAKNAADAPFGHFDEKPITKGVGRFGPFIKWNSLFISIPKAYSIENITQAQAATLIEAKLEKEANRYIQQWTEENLVIENGRWGPFIRHGKDNYKIPKEEVAETLSLAEVKKIVLNQNPKAFDVAPKVIKAPAKGADVKGADVKKAPAKRAAAKKK